MKSNRRKSRVALLGGLLALTGLPGAVLSGCESASEPPMPTSTPPDLEGVVYDGLATDEALTKLLGLDGRSEPAQNAALDNPAPHMSLPAASPATFAWHIGEMASVSPSFYERVLTFVAMLGPRNAYAHGAPVNGRAYFLVFSTPSAPKLLRVFTTELTYTPDDLAWSSLVSVEGPISLTITNAIFEDNRVAQDGGPFTGSAVPFSITP